MISQKLFVISKKTFHDIIKSRINAKTACHMGLNNFTNFTENTCLLSHIIWPSVFIPTVFCLKVLLCELHAACKQVTVTGAENPVFVWRAIRVLCGNSNVSKNCCLFILLFESNQINHHKDFIMKIEVHLMSVTLRIDIGHLSLRVCRLSSLRNSQVALQI